VSCGLKDEERGERKEWRWAAWSAGPSEMLGRRWKKTGRDWRGGREEEGLIFFFFNPFKTKLSNPFYS
jgi:hypothetical protein